MHDESGNVAAQSDVYAYGDAEAGDDVGLPVSEIRKMRRGGLLKGAYAKLGHRTYIYHRNKLRQRINEAFTKGGIEAAE